MAGGLLGEGSGSDTIKIEIKAAFGPPFSLPFPGSSASIIADDGTATCSSELDDGRIEVIVSGTAYDGEIEAFLDAIEIV